MALGNELRGGDEFGRGADAVRGHLRMVLQDGLAMVFLENPSSKLESNAISESRGFTGLEQEGASSPWDKEDLLSNRAFNNLADFNRFIGMLVEGFEEET